MSAAAASPTQSPPVARLMPRNDVIRLHGIKWEDYRKIRDDQANDHVRMHYADGELLLMTTGDLHERLSHLIGLYLTVWARAHKLPMMAFGRWTLFIPGTKRGLEADNCYYVGDVPDVRGMRKLDLATDPAPNLAVEIDITSDSEMKFSIYQTLGVQEVWVWRDSTFQVYLLGEDGYAPVERSELLPDLPLQQTAQLLIQHYASDEGTVLEAFLNDV